MCCWCITLRASVVRGIFRSVGKNVNIAAGVRFGKGKNISIGDNSGIGQNSSLGSMGSIIIGKNMMIAPEVKILTGGHDYSDPKKTLIDQFSVVADVVIGDDCWIGARAIILPGVVIADRVIVGAGSVVVKSLNYSGIYAGNPAVKVKALPS